MTYRTTSPRVRLLAVLATLALALLAAGPTATAKQAPVGLRLSLGEAHVDRGASASVGPFSLVLSGTSVADHVTVFVDTATGELVIRVVAGQIPPGPPCTPPPTTLVSDVRCAPGSVSAIVGDLGSGDDSFRAGPDVRVFVGARIGNRDRPLAGGPGRDALFGGALGDGLLGGAGTDRLEGRKGTDFLNGAGGPDRVAGGPASDLLFGGSGRDRLNGGGGRDRCAGGGGIDRSKGCDLFRTIP